MIMASDRKLEPSVPDLALVQSAMHELSKGYLDDGLRAEYVPALAEKYAYLLAPDRVIPAEDTTLQLSKLTEHGKKLFLTMASLQSPAIEALKFHRPTLAQFEGVLQLLIERAVHAQLSESPVVGKRGPKFKLQPRRIAEAAAEDFHHLTGKPPTRSVKRGGFVAFLTAIFNALGVAANLDQFAKEAISEWKRRHPFSNWPAQEKFEPEPDQTKP